jgi:LuxR family transcriptional regulator
MLQDVFELEGQLAAGTTLDERLDRAIALTDDFGFTGFAYDYTPVGFTPEGDVITPSLVKLRNLPDGMLNHWCDDGFYQIDPVQRVALKSSTPFIWSYRPDGRTPINSILSEVHAPVVEYLNDTHLPNGMTVPIHMPGGSCAVVTGFWSDAEVGFERRAATQMAQFTMLANILNAMLQPMLDERAQETSAVRLTARERECVLHSADGLSAKEIARRLDRSVPTIVMHLQAAARKLGARNRAQTIARAAHYRLLG